MSRRPPCVLTVEETGRILDVTGRADADTRDHTLVALPLATGLRLAELCALDLEDVRTGRGVRSVLTVVRKGGVTGSVAVPKDMRRKLGAYLRWRERQDLAQRGPLWVGRGGRGAPAGSRLSRRGAQLVLTRWGQRCGIDCRRLTFHSLRHTFCDRLRRTPGVDLRIVQMAAGHLSLETTARYTHPTLGDVQDAVEGLAWA